VGLERRRRRRGEDGEGEEQRMEVGSKDGEDEELGA
jgi:hypothetical protein